MPLVVGISTIIIEMNLFPNDSLGLLSSDGVANGCPDFTPVNVGIGEPCLPLEDRMVLCVLRANDLPVEIFTGNGLKGD